MRKLYDEGILPVLRNIKRIKFLLFSFVVFGTLGQFSFPQQLDETSWDSVSGSSVLNSPYLDDAIQQKYLSSEDEDTDVSVSKRPGDLFSVYIPGHSTLPIINLNFETHFNSINSFHYILTFGFSPLRSPPLFS
ncbi:MAG: hypothetical protein WBD99_00285 [Thermodesulfobacteriota bacterium]